MQLRTGTHAVINYQHANENMLKIYVYARYGNALLQFDKKEEARVRLKIDFYVLPTVFLIYLFAFIDRANIGNARLAGLEQGPCVKQPKWSIENG